MTTIIDTFSGQPLIIGAGIAGLMTALRIAPEPVVVLTKARLGAETSTDWAQGGIAAALGVDDSPALHAEDTMAAGAGLSDRRAVDQITSVAGEVIGDLVRLGMAFDRHPDGQLNLGLEAAHSRSRIVHAEGDRTGHAIMQVLIDAVRRTQSITVLEDVEVRRLLVEDGELSAVLAMGPDGALVFPGRRVILATGGIGGLYSQTTNPLGAMGLGLALAARSGAELADLEFVQFHPTALDVGVNPMPLVSEAVRGEGAVLIDESGERFMAAYPRAELEPRDVVARAVWQRLAEGHRVFLDARSALGALFRDRFPGIAAACRAVGIDPERAPIPVRPAAHYHMGGISVDEVGRSSIHGLWACGEVASTGLHGANRLASNSLLEALVCARWVAESVSGTTAPSLRTPRPVEVPPAPDPRPVRKIMSEQVGLTRDAAGLLHAIERLQALALDGAPSADPALVGLMIATAALRRTESRGAHQRVDFPNQLVDGVRRLTIRIDDVGRQKKALPAGPAATQVGA